MPSQKIEFLGLKIDSVRMKCQNLISNPRTALWKVTSFVGSLCSTAQAVLPSMLQQQIAAGRKNPSYQSEMYLNQDSIQELLWWFNNLEICNGKLIAPPTFKTVIQISPKRVKGRIVRNCQQWDSRLSRS